MSPVRWDRILWDKGVTQGCLGIHQRTYWGPGFGIHHVCCSFAYVFFGISYATYDLANGMRVYIYMYIYIGNNNKSRSLCLYVIIYNIWETRNPMRSGHKLLPDLGATSWLAERHHLMALSLCYVFPRNIQCKVGCSKHGNCFIETHVYIYI